MKKILSKITGAILVFTLTVSCNSDDNNNQSPENMRVVEYKLTTSAPTILSIHYFNNQGTEVNVEESFTGRKNWSKAISVPDGTFTAAFSFEAESPSGSSMEYVMKILVDGVEKQSRTEIVTGSTNRDISYELE